ncbi:sensor histidine kinase KdpD [Streptomyces rimosus]|uniref:sensor histidine kinase n=1 Tax=Streptomyces rimosus TaxID=1927 RepID=UPI00067D75EE|nr:ATP-binding protein [Streptomyces rimosus]
MPAAFPQGTPAIQEIQGSPGSPQGAESAPAGPRRREREGGRHGRAAFPETAADSAIRARLVRLAAVPCLLVAATCSAATAFVVRVGGTELTGRDWTVLLGACAVVCAVVTAAGTAANNEARAAVARYARLREVCARGRHDLHDLLDHVREGEWLQQPEREPAAVPPAGDALDLLAHEVAEAGRAAEAAVLEGVAIARGNASGNEQKVEVFVNLARRLQSLVHREIELLDELENQVEDPDLLKSIFHVDHLATRIRRHAENLAVLGGAISRRQWSRPVTMTEVLRSSIAEVEQYPRIKLVPPIEGTLRGHAVADVIHLLAELVENATVYSSPQTSVLLRAQLVTAGLAVEVEDRGLGMSLDEQTRMNGLLADPDHVDVAELLSDGRIGLFVVSSLARRHGIVVRLQSNIYGGVQAVLVVPKGLLGPETERGQGDEPFADAGDVDLTVPEPRTLVGADTSGYRSPYDEDGDAPRGPRRRLVQAAHGAPVAGTAEGAYPDIVYGDGVWPSATDTPHAGTRAVHATAAPADGPYPTGAHRAPDPLTGADRHPDPHHPVPPAAADPGPLLMPPAPPAADDGDRPSLPRRRKQEHLVPQLRGDPILPSAGRRDGRPEPEHDPGLMAAFRRGISLADESYGSPADHDGFDSYRAGTEAGHDRTDPRRGDDRDHGE